MISTSEIKISVVIAAKYGELRRARPARRVRRGAATRGGGDREPARIQIYDTTLRDGCQAEDISLTIEDKLRITERLDDFGIRYVEGGWPGSNPRDEAYFERGAGLCACSSIKVAAFGSTRRAGVRASEDRNLRKLLRAETPVVTIFGKSWDLHVRDDLRIPLEENLEIIHDTMRYLKQHVGRGDLRRRAFLRRLAAQPGLRPASAFGAAADAGADLLCLCDTNGGRLPEEIAAGVDVAAPPAVPSAIGDSLPQRFRAWRWRTA